jgi:hypothetical protein
VLKDLVRQETEQEETKHELRFSKKMAAVILKNMDEVLSSRAVYVLAELASHPETKPLVAKQLKENKKAIEKLFKE